MGSKTATKALQRAVRAASPILQACSYYVDAPSGGQFVRAPPVAPQGGTATDLTPPPHDPNGVALVLVPETLSYHLATRTFTQPTEALAIAAAATAIEVAISAAIVGRAKAGEVAGPAILVFVANATSTPAGPNTRFSIDFDVVSAKDASGSGHFA